MPWPIPRLRAPNWREPGYLCADGTDYAILDVDDSDPGWLMITLDIPDATVLWGKELETKPCKN